MIVFLIGCVVPFLSVEPTATPIPPTDTPTPEVSDIVFKTPEEAILHYFEGVAQSDAEKILQACAVNEMSKNFKFDLYTERLKVLMPVQFPAPADYPFYIEANKMQLTAQIFNSVKIFAFSLLSSEEVGEGRDIIIDTKRTNAFIQDVNPERLARLEVMQIGLPNEDIMNNERYRETAAKLAAIYGADESTERVALFSFEKNYYYVGFTLLRYGETWKISGQVSPLANTKALGTPEETTVEEFESMIKGD
jgi:hypothetical protein